ncbi:uroporphyrinogen-III C-methyltransferase [Thermanaerovibrio acidaminovorans]|uniref:uroporphyrinogen-III C-methyltransferase n=1 Tax=Thermanaerovibrio acidaminovorans TaxID=81462 RepID=UPI0024920A03|nr:uroporphyrinogen-III C-methyltransferase [Thermanaerovibrio acidaminovorans]
MIWLTGGGCASPRWLTQEGAEALGSASAVVYDRLIHPDLLLLCPPGALFIQAGKRGSDHTMSQEEINRLLVELAADHPHVVRLKGGDPFVFGRGGEEAQELDRHGIPWRAVPGVTAALGGLLKEGIPVTHRGAASAVCLATGHLEAPSESYWGSLARFDGSRVLYMSASNLPENLGRLISLGLPEDEPCVAVTWGGWGRSYVVGGTAGEGARGGWASQVRSPSVVMIGGSARVRLTPAELPLKGLTVAVCRPMPEGYQTARRLEALGADAFTLPLLEVRPTASREELLASLEGADTVVFTSPRGPKVFRDLVMDLRLLRCRTVAIGEGTRRSLEEMGIGVDLMPERADSRSLAELLVSCVRPGERILFLRNRRCSPLPVEAVRRAGALALELPIYEMVPRGLPWRELILEHWQDTRPHAVVFGSAALAEAFADEFGPLPAGAVPVAWGEECAKRCGELFRRRGVVMASQDLDGLVSALLEIRGSEHPPKHRGRG